MMKEPWLTIIVSTFKVVDAVVCLKIKAPSMVNVLIVAEATSNSTLLPAGMKTSLVALGGTPFPSEPHVSASLHKDTNWNAYLLTKKALAPFTFTVNLPGELTISFV